MKGLIAAPFFIPSQQGKLREDCKIRNALDMK
jgi:hypothetical protein